MREPDNLAHGAPPECGERDPSPKVAGLIPNYEAWLIHPIRRHDPTGQPILGSVALSPTGFQAAESHSDSRNAVLSGHIAGVSGLAKSQPSASPFPFMR